MCKPSKKIMLCVFLAISLLLICQNGKAEPICPEPAALMPDDTLMFIEVADTDRLCDQFKKTATYQMTQDPAVQPFVDDARSKIQPKIDEALSKLWKDIGLENPPECFPIPKGQIIVAVMIQPRVVTYEQNDSDPDIPADQQNPNNGIVREMTVPDFQVVALIQCGEQLEAIQNLIRQCADKMIEDGAFRQTEDIHQVEFQIIKKNQEEDPDIDTPIYGFKNDMLIAGSSLKYIRQVMRKLDGSDETASLAQRHSFSKIRDRIGSGELFLYFNGRRCTEIIKAVSPESQQAETDRILQLLGMDCFEGVAASLSLAGRENENSRFKAMLSTPGGKKGLFAMLAPQTGPITPSRLIAKNTYTFMIANYDIPLFYDQLMYLISAITNKNIGMIVQGSMAMTGDPQQTGQPPVDLRQDIIAQLAGPISFHYSIDPPYTIENQQMLFAVGVRDRETLDHAMARIHTTFIAMGNPELRREFLDTNLYLLPFNPMMPMMPMGAMDTSNLQSAMDMNPPSPWAFAVTTDHFVIGPVALVEQAIRDSRRETTDNITSDAMYQYARRFAPDQTGILAYSNNQINGEIMWNLLKQVAQLAKELQNHQEQDMPMPDSPAMIWAYMFKEIGKYCDVSLLPEFDVVKHYFGPGISYVQSTDNGIFIEGFDLKAPPLP